MTAECQAFRGVLGAKVVILKRASQNTLQAWLPTVNQRRRRALGCAPNDRIGVYRQAMLALPPVPPATGWRASTRP